MKKSFVFLVIIVFVIAFFLLLIKKCNTYRGLVPIKEQRCKCLGLLVKERISSTQEGPTSDTCIGIIVEKHSIQSK